MTCLWISLFIEAHLPHSALAASSMLFTVDPEAFTLRHAGFRYKAILCICVYRKCLHEFWVLSWGACHSLTGKCHIWNWTRKYKTMNTNKGWVNTIHVMPSLVNTNKGWVSTSDSDSIKDGSVQVLQNQKQLGHYRYSRIKGWVTTGHSIQIQTGSLQTLQYQEKAGTVQSTQMVGQYKPFNTNIPIKDGSVQVIQYQ